VHLNRKFVKLGLAAAAPLMLVGAVALPGSVASAKGKAPAETLNCTGLTATITFTPPLVPTTSSTGYSKTETTTITNESLSGCTGSPNSSPVTASTQASATIPKGKSGNTCAGFGASAAKSKFTFTTTWNNSGGSSTAKFKGATVNTAPAGFSLTNGKVSGSFKDKDASVTANLSSGSETTFAACEGGTGDVSQLTISNGSASL
jgi:hypothetical protein